jgi:hypothetical protein
MKNTIMMLVVLALVLFAGFGCEKTTEIEKNELTVTVMGQNVPESGTLFLETGVYTLDVHGDSAVNISLTFMKMDKARCSEMKCRLIISDIRSWYSRNVNGLTFRYS